MWTDIETRPMHGSMPYSNLSATALEPLRPILVVAAQLGGSVSTIRVRQCRSVLTTSRRFPLSPLRRSPMTTGQVAARAQHGSARARLPVVAVLTGKLASGAPRGILTGRHESRRNKRSIKPSLAPVTLHNLQRHTRSFLLYLPFLRQWLRAKPVLHGDRRGTEPCNAPPESAGRDHCS